MTAYRMIVLSLLLTLMIGLPACDETDSGTFNGINFIFPPRELRPEKGHYEIWLGFSDGQGGKEWVSILKFDDVRPPNEPFLDGSRSTFTKPNRDANEAIAAAVSIEIPNDPDPATPNRIFMSGNTDGSSVVLNTKGEDAFDLDLTNPSVISGSFVLATPSDTIDGNDASGAWFVDRPFGGAQEPEAGLTLPDLPEGWRFEAWIAPQTETVCISISQFDKADTTDDNGAGPNGGSQPIPNAGTTFIFQAVHRRVYI